MAEKWPLWHRLSAAVRLILVGYSEERQRPENAVWVWCRGVAFPALLFALGIELMLSNVDTFWLGVVVGTLGVVLAALDLYWITRGKGRSEKVLASFILLAAASLIAYVIWRPLPLVVTFSAPDPNYEEGADIHGIPWETIYSELSVNISNDTNSEFHNADIFLRADSNLVIANSGVEDGFNSCIAITEAPEPQVSDMWMSRTNSNGNHVVVDSDPKTKAIGTFSHVRCSSFAPHSRLNLYFALIPIEPTPNSNLPTFTNVRKPVRWAAAIVNYEAGNRTHSNFVPVCLSSVIDGCRGIPDSAKAAEADSVYLRKVGDLWMMMKAEGK